MGIDARLGRSTDESNPATTEEIIMSMDSFKELYIDELKDLYNAENQLVKAVQKWAKKAAAPK